MKDKGGCVTSPVGINKLFLTKPICERMLQCTLTTNNKTCTHVKAAITPKHQKT